MSHFPRHKTVRGIGTMNVARGLFRAWTVISILWIIGAGSVAYGIVSPDRGGFQPDWETKGGLKPWEVMRSPSAEKLSITFSPVDWQDGIKWDKDWQDGIKWDNELSMAVVTMPDGSRIYMNANYNDADKNYIAKQFWDQRWGRYGYTAGIVALWALTPCALLFILGYALLWVGRGFRHA